MGETKKRRDFMNRHADASWCPYNSYQIKIADTVTKQLNCDGSAVERLVRVLAALLYDRDGPLPKGRSGRCIQIAGCSSDPTFMDIDETTRQITVTPVVLRAPTAPPLAFSRTGVMEMLAAPAIDPMDLAGMKIGAGRVTRSMEPGKSFVTRGDEIALRVRFGEKFDTLKMPVEERMELIGKIQQSQNIELRPDGTSTMVIKLTPRIDDIPERYEYAALFEEELVLVTDMNEKTVCFGFMSDFYEAPTH